MLESQRYFGLLLFGCPKILHWLFVFNILTDWLFQCSQDGYETKEGARDEDPPRIRKVDTRNTHSWYQHYRCTKRLCFATSKVGEAVFFKKHGMVFKLEKVSKLVIFLQTFTATYCYDLFQDGCMQLIATFDSSLSNGNGAVDVVIYIFNNLILA